MQNAAEVLPINIEDEMKGAYLDYAMSVIVGRAIPDVRDGLKPAHRRILYAMFREGLLSSKRYSKCAGVVGEVLKKYHPHGDQAVYDTLVRMAQDWNMRSPLIDGQGNFGCFTGNTRVRLADGTSKSFLELIEDEKKGLHHFTYTIWKGGKIAMAPIRSPRLTKRNVSIVAVTLDNGEAIKCTPDHRYMLRDGTYREAQHLKRGDSLMPFYSRSHEGSDANLQGYEEVYDPGAEAWSFAHHVADAFNLEAGAYPRSAGRVRHHRDFQKQNNDPRNIVRMQWAAHRRVHMEQLNALWSDDDFRKKMKGVLAKLWKDETFREKTIKAIGEENARRWRSPAFQKKQRLAKAKLWSAPAFRERILDAAMEKNILLHGTEEQKANITKAQREWLANMWKDPQYRRAQQERMREISYKLWSDEGHREAMSAFAKKRWCDPEYRATRSKESKARWRDETYREFHCRRSARQWQDPTYRAKHEKHLSANGQKTVRSRFLSICRRALDADGEINAAIYEQLRRASGVAGVLRYEKGLDRYFDGDEQALEQAAQAHQGMLNHTVVSVKPAGNADVYDLTVDESHNFALDAGVFVHNSIDGDSAAAYRYTEARLTALAEELLADIDKETVDFIPNFDETTVEPVVLPAKFPNLLVNGSDGIAVGMATKIPPHNLGEVVDACITLIDTPDIGAKELLRIVPGPDFPTGAFIHGREGIKQAYETGRGQIKLRARAAIEPMAKGDREQIVITEIPYQVNKAKLIERIADLVRNGKIDGISDIRDESDRDGMRIVVELKRGVVAGVVMNQLYAHTQMQTGFGIILLSIVAGQPRVLSLKEMLAHFIDHRREVVTRRTTFELKKAEARAHILEGLKIAVENIDEVVALIKKAKEPAAARAALCKRFTFSEIQAQAVLDMRLQRLTGLERAKIIEEYKAIQKLIAELKAILADERKVYDIVRDELTEMKKKFADARRTVIKGKAEDLSVEDLIQEEEMIVTISHRGYIKRNPISVYRAQRRGGRGKQGANLRSEDFVSDLFIASTHSSVLVFSTGGKVYWLKVHEIPQVGRTARGGSISNLIHMPADERIAAVLPVRAFEEGRFIVTVTEKGIIKKTDLMAFSNPRSGGIIATNVDEDDRLIEARLTTGEQQIFLTTRAGKAIRFSENDVRAMGRSARGVRAMTLGKGDVVVGMSVLATDAPILTVTEKGYGKRSACDDYRVQSRGGSGIITIKVADRNGPVVGAMPVTDTDHIMIVTNGGKVIRSRAKEIPVIGRSTQGVRLISLGKNEKVVTVERLVEESEEES